MAGRIRLKLGGIAEGMQENDLAKEFFGSVNVGRGQVGGPQVPLILLHKGVKSSIWPLSFTSDMLLPALAAHLNIFVMSEGKWYYGNAFHQIKSRVNC